MHVINLVIVRMIEKRVKDENKEEEDKRRECKNSKMLFCQTRE